LLLFLQKKKILPYLFPPIDFRRHRWEHSAQQRVVAHMASPITETATRIAAGDDRERYDNFSIMLHWATAALVVAQFALGETWGFAGKPVRHVMIVTHTSLGLILALVIATRLLWRLTPGHKVRSAVQGWVETASKSVHYLLYFLLVAQALLGLSLGMFDDHPMSFFGLPVPTPFSPWPDAVHHQVGDIHNWVGWTIIVVAAGHAAAALYHHYALRDDVLARMMPGRDA
jgi:cytochrome b561